MSRFFRLFAGAAISIASVSASTPAQSPRPVRIAYRIAMPEPATHLFEIEMDVEGVPGSSLALQLPVWSPGRYARMDFAKNIQDFRATDAAGAPLSWTKSRGDRWLVATRGRPARIRYKSFDNALSGTFSVLDTAHANWNGASLFMYVEGRKQNPVTLHISPPVGWRIINGDTRTADQRDYRFENYDRLIDTPTEIAPALTVDSFYVDGKKYRTAVHHNGLAPAGVRERFVRDVEKIVRYENTVFTAPPLEQYTFLFNIGYPGGDGMEHLYSTQIIDSRAFADSFTVLPGLGTAAHEYFHVWNVKRVRPAALGPFDYSRNLPAQPLGRRGMDAVLRSGCAPSERHHRRRAFLSHHGGADPPESHRAGPQGSVPAHGLLPCAVLGRRAAGTAHERRQHLLQLLHVGRGPRAVSRPVHPRSDGEPPVAGSRVQFAQAPHLGRAE
ncbi:MAG TPA: hypothetical protein VM033_07300 [Gemmatimonadaceae bacterium]|nr:hypothetical protein [Gemmatimonadaceae bacterium]